MADISQIKIPSGSTYDIKDAVSRARMPIYYVAGPSSNTTAGTWTGTIEGLTAYSDGLTVVYVPAVAGASTTKLNINGLGAKTCYYNGTSKLTTHYPAGTPIMLTYIDGTWKRADYYKDTTYTTFSKLARGGGNYVADSALYPYNIVVSVDENTLAPFNNYSGSSTSTSKTIRTDLEFDPFGEFYQYYSDASIAANGDIPGSDLVWAADQITLTYSFNISSAVNPLTNAKNVYMKVIPLSNGKVKIFNALPFVHTLPETPDGYWYIYMGRTKSTYQISMHPHHVVFACQGKIVDNNRFTLKGKAALEWNETDQSIDFVFI